MSTPCDRSTRCSPSTPSWSSGSPTRRCTPTRPRPQAGPPLRRAGPGRRRRPRAGAARDDLAAARELAAEDQAFAAEAETLAERIARAGDQLAELLVPRDPHDADDVHDGDQVRRGRRGVRAVRRRPAADVPALRRAAAAGRPRCSTPPSPTWAATRTSRCRCGQGQPDRRTACGPRLKFEGGVHRVQRVPVTESQGRIHTSAAGVLVYPEAEDVEVEIDEKDLRIDVYRSSGPAGRASTPPTPRCGSPTCRPASWCPARTSSPSCRTRPGRMRGAARPAAGAGRGGGRPSRRRPTGARQVRTVDRSERVRTYNFPENRISDHRVGYKAYNLDAVLDGDLDAVLDALSAAERRRRRRRPSAAPAARRGDRAGLGRHRRVRVRRVSRHPLRLAILEAERVLADAGVESPARRRRAARRARAGRASAASCC